ncbi:MAG: DUF3562 domain-containing protein [Syntrophaceae bacterium]|jgi:signal recognition particle GTPase|nr:DUF3562 domain-containing protein [Syntrophaceae bacterium]
MIPADDFLYEDDSERKHHSSAIRRIAENSGNSVEKVEKLYEENLRKLKPRARVKDFLSILVSREVEAILRS